MAERLSGGWTESQAFCIVRGSGEAQVEKYRFFGSILTKIPKYRYFRVAPPRERVLCGPICLTYSSDHHTLNLGLVAACAFFTACRSDFITGPKLGFPAR
jgi:hypothetical protein